jgi:hypothetical protein
MLLVTINLKNGRTGIELGPPVLIRRRLAVSATAPPFEKNKLITEKNTLLNCVRPLKNLNCACRRLKVDTQQRAKRNLRSSLQN